MIQFDTDFQGKQYEHFPHLFWHKRYQRVRSETCYLIKYSSLLFPLGSHKIFCQQKNLQSHLP